MGGGIRSPLYARGFNLPKKPYGGWHPLPLMYARGFNLPVCSNENENYLIPAA